MATILKPPILTGILKETYPALWVVHRLDRQTSGVIVFARTAAAHRDLNTQFEQRRAVKPTMPWCRACPPGIAEASACHYERMATVATVL